MSRDALFDLAVNRALLYAARLGSVEGLGEAELVSRLELWYLKTRFAYRIPLKEVVEKLRSYPGGRYYWTGGGGGGWVPGENPNP